MVCSWSNARSFPRERKTRIKSPFPPSIFRHSQVPTAENSRARERASAIFFCATSMQRDGARESVLHVVGILQTKDKMRMHSYTVCTRRLLFRPAQKTGCSEIFTAQAEFLKGIGRTAGRTPFLSAGGYTAVRVSGFGIFLNCTERSATPLYLTSKSLGKRLETKVSALHNILDWIKSTQQIKDRN